MKKVNFLLSLFLTASLLTYTGCTEKETPVPTENTARVDQLRNELRRLHQELLGENAENSYLTMQVEELQAELEKLQKEKDRRITYTVYATDLQGIFLPGAKVSIAIDGKIETKDTDAEGKAVFSNVRSGLINGVVKLNDFATTNYTASIAFGEDFVSSKVAMLPLAGDTRTFTVEGNLFANLSDADDNLGYKGVVTNIRGTDVSIHVAEGQNGGNTKYDGQARKIFIVPIVKDIPAKTGFGAAGDIQNIAFENAVFETTAAADGSFSIKLPLLTNAAGEELNAFNGYRVNFEEFSATKTLLSAGQSSNAAYSNSPYSLYHNKADASTDLPATTEGFIQLKTYTENRIFRAYSDDLDDMIDSNYYDIHAGEKVKMKVFYSEYKN